jgi:hypothetical protein
VSASGAAVGPMTEVSRWGGIPASAEPGQMGYEEPEYGQLEYEGPEVEEPEVEAPEYEEREVDASPRARPFVRFIKSPATQTLFALAVYVAVWLSTVASTLVGHPTDASIAQRNMDPDLFVWVVGWWPYAIGHGLNPLFSSLVSAPAGQPLGWVTTVPPLAILASPLTLTAGPLVSFSFLTALGPPLSAWGAFVLCRRLTGKFWPALVGGAVFGFSAYETRSAGVGQLDLCYSVLLPILAYLMVVWWQRGIRSRTYVILAAAALAVQFYLFTEIFADLTAILVVALLLGFALAGRKYRPVVLRLGGLTAVGYLIAVVLASPLIIAALSSKAPKAVPFTATDLASFVLPRPYSLPRIAWLTNAALGAHPISTAGYIGVPLLILAVLLAVTSWRNRLVRLLTCMLVLIILASLGPVVYLQGRPEARLPWAALFDLPVVRNAWMSRLMIFAFLALAVATALWLSHPRSLSTWRQWLFPSLRWLLAALVVVSVVIDVFPAKRNQLTAAPAFITSGQYRFHLSPGEIVVVVSGIPNAGLLWQAQSRYNIRLAGGFFNEGFGSFSDEPPAVAGLQRRNYALANAFVAYVKRDKIGAILVDAAHEPGWARLIPRVGLVGHLIGGVLVYPTDGCRACSVPTKHL